MGSDQRKVPRVRHEHPTRVGEHYVEGLDDDTVWSPWAEYVDGISLSRYGDPEIALIQEETPIEEADWDAHYEEAQRVWACLHPLDRIMLHLSMQGVPQEEIGATIGVTQSSVCTRMQRLYAWGGFVVPRRLRARGEPEPTRWVVDKVLGGVEAIERKGQEARDAWRLCAWQHRSSVDVARILGLTQGRGLRAIHHACRAVLAAGHPGLGAIAEAILGDITKWTRPQASGLSTYNDYGRGLVALGKGLEQREQLAPTSRSRTEVETTEEPRPDPRQSKRYLELRRAWMLREWEHDFLDELDLLELDALGVIDLRRETGV